MKTYKFTITGTIQVEEVKEAKTFSIEQKQCADRILEYLKKRGPCSESKLYTIYGPDLRTDEFAEVMKFLTLACQVTAQLDAHNGTMYRAVS